MFKAVRCAVSVKCASFRQFPHIDLQTSNADFILPSHFMPLHEFVLNPLIVKPLQHASIMQTTETNKVLNPTLQACIHTAASYNV